MPEKPAIKPASPRNPGFFYGYVVVAACFLTLFLIHGPASTFGVFFSSLQSEFGWSRTILSGASAVGGIMWGTLAIFAGRLTDRFGPKLVLTTFCIITGFGYIGMSWVNSIWQVYLFLGIFVAFGNGASDVTTLSTTAKWFTKRRGIMSGFVKVGTGAGMMIVPLVATHLIQSYGWRHSYLIIGITALALILVVVQFLKRDPAQIGLQPYGADDSPDTPRPETGLSLGEASRTRQFWLLGGMFFLTIYSVQTIVVHIVPHALDSGLSAAQAAVILSIVGAVSIVSRLFVGALGDRIGHHKVMMLNLFVFAVALCLLLFSGTLWSFYLFAMVYGYAHGSFFATMSPLVAEVFGMRAHGTLLGMLIFIGWLGQATGPLAAGWMFDTTRTYQPAFIILLVFSITGLTLAALLRPLHYR